MLLRLSSSVNHFQRFSPKPLGKSKPSWVGGTKVCSRQLGHIPTWPVAPIYGKNSTMIFFSGTSVPITTKLDMYGLEPGPSIACSNDDPGLTLTYFRAVSILVFCEFI